MSTRRGKSKKGQSWKKWKGVSGPRRHSHVGSGILSNRYKWARRGLQPHLICVYSISARRIVFGGCCGSGGTGLMRRVKVERVVADLVGIGREFQVVTA